MEKLGYVERHKMTDMEYVNNKSKALIALFFITKLIKYAVMYYGWKTYREHNCCQNCNRQH